MDSSISNFYLILILVGNNKNVLIIQNRMIAGHSARMVCREFLHWNFKPVDMGTWHLHSTHATFSPSMRICEGFSCKRGAKREKVSWCKANLSHSASLTPSSHTSQLIPVYGNAWYHLQYPCDDNVSCVSPCSRKI